MVHHLPKALPLPKAHYLLVAATNLPMVAILEKKNAVIYRALLMFNRPDHASKHSDTVQFDSLHRSELC